jgi:hypothetical protein
VFQFKVPLHQLFLGFLEVNLPEVNYGVFVEREDGVTRDLRLLYAEDLERVRCHDGWQELVRRVEIQGRLKMAVIVRWASEYFKAEAHTFRAVQSQGGVDRVLDIAIGQIQSAGP